MGNNVLRWGVTGLLVVLFLLETVRAQQACQSTERPGLNVYLQWYLYEATDAELSADPDSYLYNDRVQLAGTLDRGDSSYGVEISLVSEPLLTPENIEPSSYFRVYDGSQGLMIRLVRGLDREGRRADASDDLTIIPFGLWCERVSDGERFYFSVAVHLEDVNDNSPVFQHLPYEATVNELSPIGVPIQPTVTATDIDSGRNGDIDYQITQGDGSASDGSTKFRISLPRVGMITVSGQLDYEELKETGRTYYMLNISANDDSINFEKRTAYTTMRVTITDGDDQGPTFDYNTCHNYGGRCINPVYTASVPSNDMVGQLTVQPEPIMARDMDTLNYPVQYSFINGVPENYADYFSIVPTSGAVMQTRAINRQEITEMSITIKAEEVSQNKRYTTAQLTISVTSVNEYAPLIQSSVGDFIGYIYENSPIMTFVSYEVDAEALQLLVSDPDQTAGDPETQFNYRVDGTGVFGINDNGFVVLNVDDLDYESTQQITFKAIVTEANIENPRSSSVDITVRVRDVNDNSPVFPPSGYSIALTEGDGNSRRDVVRVQATDADSGAFGDVTYEITSVSNDGGSKFEIDSQTGQIEVTGVVVRDEDYTLTVQARDGGSGNNARASMTSVRIEIVLGQNLGPLIPAAQYTMSVSEGIVLNTPIFSVPATDPESDPLQFSITGGNTGGMFAIERNTGVVTNADLLDRETLDTYSLRIMATDQDTSRSATTTLSITVTDVNDNNPQFSSAEYTFSVRENLNNEFVGTVQATDADLGSNGQVQYLIPEESGRMFFSIGATSGQIRTVNQLDYETASSHTLLITAFDSSVSSRSTVIVVTINVEDEEDMVPVFLDNQYDAMVPENEVNYLVTTVQAVDMDERDDIQYIIVRGDTGRFRMDTANGQLTVIQALDYERQTEYSLVVSTRAGSTSQNNPQTSATVSISVVDKNDFTPTFDKSVYTAPPIKETDPTGTQVIAVSAIDDDPDGPNSNINYGIQSVNPNTGTNFFYISPDTGGIVISQPLDTDRENSRYDITVTATDMGEPPLSSTAQVSVTVIRNNYSPEFTPPQYAKNIDFTLGVDQPVQQVTARDDDSDQDFSRISFSIVGDGLAMQFFKINSQSGMISIARSLIEDSGLVYVIRVQAMDGGGRTSEGIVTVTVNRNLNAPRFEVDVYEITIQDNEPLASSFTRTQAVDNDIQPPHNQVVYSLTGDSTAMEYFMVDENTGFVSLKKSVALDPNRLLRYQPTISARDLGMPTSRQATNRATVVVDVVRNENAPIFFNQTYYATIRQDAPTRSNVIIVSATDADVAEDFRLIRYAIIGDDRAPEFFQVNEDTGQITTLTSLTSDTTELYRTRVVAYDNGNPPRSATTMVLITVLRNFYAPQWVQTNYQVTTEETQALGVAFLRVSATDRDSVAPNNMFTFIGTGNDLAQEYFEVDEETGEITVRQSLLTDTSTTYQFQLRAVDMGSPPQTSDQATVNIEVVRNDNPPFFENENYAVSITMNQATGQRITSVRATDSDPVDRFGVVRYRIIGDDSAPTYFEIHEETGDITLRSSVSSDTQTMYNIRVEAYDNGTPSKTDVVVVKVTVNRNLNAPRFLQSSIDRNILYSQELGIAIAQVQAEDADDQAPHNVVTYHLIGDSLAQNYFMVNEDNGEVSVKRDLAADSNTRYTLTLQARDDGDPSLSSSQNARVTVNVARNLNCPRFEGTPYEANVDRDEPVGFPVDQATARDSDTTPPYNVVTYSIIGDDNAATYFEIDENDGNVVIGRSLNEDSAAVYKLRIQASDGDSPACQSTQIMTVNVNRNLNAPVFSQTQATVTIKETESFQTVIHRVDATDSDLRSPYNRVSYELTGTDQAVRFFLVDASTGEIKLKSSLLQDTSGAEQYALYIQARDGGIPSLVSEQAATITVNVIRNRYTPMFSEAHYVSNIRQDLGFGNSVARVSATDQDPTDTYEDVSYRIVGDASATYYYRINQESGLITVGADLATDLATTYLVRIEAFDNGVPPRTNITTMTVNVNRNLRCPSWVQGDSSVTMMETQDISTLVAEVRADDSDAQSPFNEVRFKIVGTTLADEYFLINSVTGQIYQRKSVQNDPALTEIYEIMVQAYDLGVPNPCTASRNATVRVTVVRNLHEPVFSNNGQYTATVREDLGTNNRVTNVQATDRDTQRPFNTIRYSIIGEESAPTFFSISEENGEIRIKTSLQTDDAILYKLKVLAVDGGTPAKSATATVLIEVTRNLNAPIFSPSRIEETVLETLGLGENIARVTATDRDIVPPNNVTRYSIRTDSSSYSYYLIDSITGQITLKRSLMEDTSERHEFRVDATDMGSPPKVSSTPATVTINIRRNKNSPQFTNLPASVTVNQTTAIGVRIFSCDARDYDTDAPFNELYFTIIGDDDAVTYFEIDDDGHISVRNDLRGAPGDEIAYQVRVMAGDGGNPSLTATAILNVNVLRNLYAPVFSQSDYSAEIQEIQTIGTSILQVRATDQDEKAPNNQVTYELEHTYFAISENGVIALKRSILGDGTMEYRLNVYAVDLGEPQQRAGPLVVFINVVRNIYTPQFAQSYSETIQQDISPGTSVLTVVANDQDQESPFNDVYYEIIGDDSATGFFRIDEGTGVITVSNNLENDATRVFKIRVVAKDGGEPARQTVTVVSVTVIRNLNEPRFEPVNYQARVLETIPIGHEIKQVDARDTDLRSPDNVVEYQVIGNDQARQYFDVNAETGQVYLVRSLTLDNAELYSVLVSAHDLGDPSLSSENTATVTVTVDRNLNAPVFTQSNYEETIIETLGGGNEVLRVDVRDDDTENPFNVVTLNLIGDESGPSFFEITTEGSIRVRSNSDLERDRTTEYKLRILASDGGTPPMTSTAVVDVTVIRNLNAPQFTNTNLRVSINDNLPSGSSIIQVEATDDDDEAPNNVIRYAITGENSAPNYFYINPESGLITLLQSVYENPETSFRVRVTATDQGFPPKSGEATVEVLVIRDRGELRFLSSSYSTSISENREVGQEIIRTTASPSDGTTYEITGSTTAMEYFHIDSTTGSIRILQQVKNDPARSPFYMIYVEAYRQFEVTSQIAFTSVNVTVRRNENAPRFSTSEYRDDNRPEDTPIGTEILTISATDSDGDVMAYSVVPKEPETSFFFLHPYTGTIYLARMLTEVDQVDFRFNVVASDQAIPERNATALVYIRVRRDLQAPIFESMPYRVTIKEVDPVGKMIFTLRGRDDDRMGQMRYAAIGTVPAPFFFEVHETSGEVRISADLMVDTNFEYNLTCITFDDANPDSVAEANLTITVTRNENSPRFENADATKNILEILSVGSIIATVTATDRDQDDVIYMLANTSSDATSQFFYVNPYSGVITLSRSLSETTITDFRVHVTARDTGYPVRMSTNNARIQVIITRNRLAPVFPNSVYEEAVEETDPVGNTVIDMTARDNDEPGPFSTINYTLIGDDAATTFFEIEQNSGRVKIKQDLRTENVEFYTLRVKANDGGVPALSATATAKVEILRNFHAPTFSPRDYSKTILETYELGVSILQVMARDDDTKAPYNVVQYDFSSTTDPKILEYFVIDGSTGIIYLKKSLMQDTSDQKLYGPFSIIATDQGRNALVSRDPARVTITVDRNEYAPVFSGEPYVKDIERTLASSTRLMAVSAPDQDQADPFRTVRYSIIGDDTAPVFFGVNPENGDVTLTASVDSDSEIEYTVRIIAEDGGSPPKTDTTVLTVNVQRNLHDPEFNPRDYDENILETQELGVPFIQVQAKDDDQKAPYNTFTFEIVGDAEGMEYFMIDEETGQIAVKKDLSLDPERRTSYTVFVQATDGGSPARSSRDNGRVNVRVTRNNNVPRWEGTLPYETTVNENQDINTQAFQVRARDDDPEGPFNSLRYTLIGDDFAPSYFSVNEAGAITVARNLEETTLEEFTVRVRVQDEGIPALTNTTTVKVTVNRNFNDPSWQQSQYAATIDEGTTLGSAIVQVSASDGDRRAPYNTVTYGLVGTEASMQCFAVNEVTGVIVLKQSLLLEPCQAASYAVRLKAYDGGDPQRQSPEAEVTITIGRNLHAPEFSRLPYTTTIRENLEVRQGVVYSVSAGDRDSTAPFNTVSYRIIGDNKAPTYFSINSDSGDINLNASLTTDSDIAYTIRVMAEDGGDPSKTSTATVLVNVNRNLDAPSFNPQRIDRDILETHPLGVVIADVNATDTDTKSPYNEIRYSITSSEKALEFFLINEITGEIYIKKPLSEDDPETTSYTIVVRAHDLGTPPLESQDSATVTVRVQRNRNCPQLQGEPYTASIDQTKAVTSEVFAVQSTDHDPTGTPFNQVTYSLLGDDQGPTYFQIDPTSGIVTVRTDLRSDDAIQYNLRVMVADGGDPPCSVTSVATISVNRNLYAPRFLLDEYVKEIMETHPLTESILIVEAEDRDDRAPHNVIRYDIEANSQYRDRFLLDAETGQLFLRRTLVGESTNQYTITVMARDMGVPESRLGQSARVVVNVIRNVQTPSFLGLPYRKNITEDVADGTLIFTLRSEDRDSTVPYGDISYSIVGDDSAPNFFAVNPDNGEISLQRSLASDTIIDYQIRVVAADGGTPPLTAMTLVQVHVNRNLNAPRFEPTSYEKEILETQPLGLPFTSVIARDEDSKSPYNVVQYLLIGDAGVTQYFMVDENTGEVSLKKSLMDDPNMRETYSFQAVAYDLGGIHVLNSTNRATLNIQVKRNKNTPQFENVPYIVDIDQNQAEAETLITVAARDMDDRQPFNVVQYSLIGDDSGPSYFQLLENGDIKLRPGVNLPADTLTEYNLRILAKDGGTPPRTATAMVDISVNRNLNPPQFSQETYTATIPEIMPAGSTVNSVAASDSDTSAPNNVLQYSLIGDGEADTYFYIHPVDGVITLLRSVMETDLREYRLRVKASDAGVPAVMATAVVTVTVQRDEGELRFTSSIYTAQTSENAETGSDVANVRASPGTDIRYEVVGTSNAPDYFSVDASSGTVSIRNDLRNDPTEITEYRLMIKASYTGVSYHEAFTYVDITVSRNERAPVFVQSEYRGEILEYYPLGQSILQVSATDQDVDDVVVYRLIENPVETDLFFLNPATGVLSLRQVWPDQGKLEYRFDVRASDQGTPEQAATAHVLITIREDSLPRFDNLPRTEVVSENAQNNSVVYDTRAVDDDRQGQLRYGVVPTSPATDIFYVHNDSGQIRIRSSTLLQSDLGFVYKIPITVYDTGRPQETATSTFTASISRNENAPSFSQTEYRITVNDRWALGQEVTSITATDTDQDVLRYEITGNARAQEYYFLNSDSGIITLKKLYTEGTQTSDEINVQVRDQSNPEKTAVSKVVVTIERDQRTPAFTENPYMTEVEEDVPVGFVLQVSPGAVLAQDDDLTGRIQYKITGEYPAQDFFSIHIDNAELRVIKDLREDSLRAAQYNLHVIAYDDIYPLNQATAVITVNVERNPNAPEFSESAYSVTVDERMELGASVMRVEATDADGDDVYYTFIGEGEPLEYFYINSDTGVITTKRFLLESDSVEFRVTVRVVDTGIPPKESTAQLTIQVIRDEYPPEFVNVPYVAASVPENRQVGTQVFTVEGRDMDQKGQLQYQAIGDPPSGEFFTVNENSGAITISRNLMEDWSPYYNLRVTVHDSGNPEQSATAVVRIPVTRNVNAPMFGQSTYEAEVNENIEVGISVLQAIATDDDGDILTYDIPGDASQGLAMEYFFVTPDTGVLHLKRSLMLDDLGTSSYRFTLAARDNRNPERSAEATVTVNVNRNNYLPEFQGQPYFQILSENAAIGSSVFTSRARDRDIQGRIKYRLVGDFPSPYFFEMNEDTGLISVKNDLTTDRSFAYKIRVMAYDDVYPEQTSTATIDVQMQRNENRPQWINETPLRVTIRETEPLGYVVTAEPNATDADGDAVLYRAVGDSAAMEFFNVDPDTGTVTKKKKVPTATLR